MIRGQTAPAQRPCRIPVARTGSLQDCHGSHARAATGVEAGSGRTPATQLAFWVVVAAIVAVAIVYGLYRLQG